MCLEDIRLGRLIRGVVWSWNVPVGTNLVVPPSQQRIGIFVPPPAGALIAPTGPILTFDNGLVFNMIEFTTMLELTLQTHGDIAMHGFTISGNVGDESGKLLLTYLTESALEESLEWVNRNRYQKA